MNFEYELQGAGFVGKRNATWPVINDFGNRSRTLSRHIIIMPLKNNDTYILYLSKERIIVNELQSIHTRYITP